MLQRCHWDSPPAHFLLGNLKTPSVIILTEATGRYTSFSMKSLCQKSLCHLLHLENFWCTHIPIQVEKRE
ncbi:mCG1039593, partial [Mus musculus]